jgi:hypothetical protein
VAIHKRLPIATKDVVAICKALPKVSQKKDKKISISHLAFGAIDIYNRLVVDKCYCGRSQFANCWEFYEKSKYISESPNKILNQQLIGQVVLH